MLISAHQTKDRISVPDKKINIAIFDNLDRRKYHVEIDSLRHPRDILLIIFEQKDYIEQYKDLKLFFEEYIGELILNPFITYPDMETNYPFGKIDLGHQLDHLKPNRIQLFQVYGADPHNARLFLILFRRKETELISDGNKLIEVKLIKTFVVV